MVKIEDCVLIRKTSVLPKDGVVETPIHGRAYEFGDSDLLGPSIHKMVRRQHPNFEEFLEAIKPYQIYFETYRRTIHFTINGIVENSLYGEFNYPYIIIEPLKYHIDSPSLEGLRVEDTYFSDDMVLSKECILFMREEDYKKVKGDIPSGIQVRTFTGDENDAVKEILQELGYEFFVVNNNGYVKGLDSGTPDQAMYEFICSYGTEHHINQDRHFYSSLNHEDVNIRMNEFRKMDQRYVNYILDSGLVDLELADEIRELLDDPYATKILEEKFDKLVEQVGLERLRTLTEEFNQLQIEARKDVMQKNK